MPNRVARKVLELVAAATLLVALFVWPHSRIGWFIQIASVLLFLACVGLLRKWPSL